MNEVTYYIKDLKMLNSILNNEDVPNNVDINCSLIYVKKDPIEESYILLIEKNAIFNRVPELATTRLLSRLRQLEIINHTYIPIFSYETQQLLFSYQDYQTYQQKINGIKEYSSNNYVFSNELYFSELDPYLDEIDNNFKVIHHLESVITSYMQNILPNINIKDCLIDIGSTGRGTNIPSAISHDKNDFDFLLFIDEEHLDEVRNILFNNLTVNNPPEDIIRVDRYRLRLKNVNIPNLDETTDIDISFSTTKEKYYSKEYILNSLFNGMQKQNEEKYRLVLANIMYTKSLLKSKGVYKHAKGIRGDHSYGGLGGIGIENWIVQNGGSFIEASKSFLDAAQDRNFIEFQKNYEVLDYGKDHICVAKGLYPYSNYIIENMRSNGYLIMKETLEEFLNNLTIPKEPRL